MASNASRKTTAAGSEKKPAASKSSTKTNTKTNIKSNTKSNTKTTTSGSRGTRTKTAASVSQRNDSEPVQEYSSPSANPLLAREALLWLILAVCVFIFISFFGIGGYFGSVVSDFCFGIFGVCAWVFPLLLFLACAFWISNRGNRLAGIKFGGCMLFYLCLCCFAALVEGNYDGVYYLGKLYARCAAGKTGGGVVGGTIVYFLAPALGSAGAAVLLVVFALIALVLVTQKSLIGGVKRQGDRVYRSAKESSERRKEEQKRRREWEQFEGTQDFLGEGTERVPAEESEKRRELRQERMSVYSEIPTQVSTQSLEPFFEAEYTSRSKKEKKKPRPAATEERQLDVSVMFTESTGERRHHRHASGVTTNTRIVGEPEQVGVNVHEILPKAYDPAVADGSVPNVSGGAYMDVSADTGSGMADDTNFINLEKEKHSGNQTPAAQTAAPEFGQEMLSLHIEGVEEEEGIKEGTAESERAVDTGSLSEATGALKKNERMIQSEERSRRKKIRTDVTEDMPQPMPERDLEEEYEERSSNSERPQKNTSSGDGLKEESETQEAGGTGKIKRNPRSSEQEIADGIASVEAEAAETAKTVRPEYVFPPLELLKKGSSKSRKGQEQEIRQTAAKLQQTLDSFGVHVTVTNVSCGPSVTRYELLPEQGVKVSRIVSLSDDIKLNLAAADIRIEAPIPGKSAVGIEVPNTENSVVPLRDLLESDEFQNHKSKLAFATGKDLAGKVVVSDIAKMPHLLIAGATGSGKSVCINTLIMSILYKAKPEEVKLIMIDPKVVELSVYNGIPHLLIPVVTDPKKAAGALNWGVAEMTDRYAKFAEVGVRDLKGYNQKIEALADVDDPEKPQKLPQIVIIVDELADLMMVAPGEVEDSICRLAQLARAAGIHLVIATQRPSVNVITGLIKANMPSRIAFSVSSGVDSRTIIDMYGAEKLLGKGDMLFYPQGYQKPARVQGAFVSDEEVSDVVDFLKNSNSSFATESDIEEQIAKVQKASAAARTAEDTDELFADAGKFIIEKDKASIGMLQRVFKIGFNRAARIMDQLSDAGVVGPEEGTKPRKILMSAEQFENYLEEN
ncbi:MAG: DNA translocase FtsK [Lachnospiraceae bacterium]|nr:DNA translocase FtsK [Lachnospiraceae bacterium]